MVMCTIKNLFVSRYFILKQMIVRRFAEFPMLTIHVSLKIFHITI